MLCGVVTDGLNSSLNTKVVVILCWEGLSVTAELQVDFYSLQKKEELSSRLEGGKIRTLCFPRYPESVGEGC